MSKYDAIETLDHLIIDVKEMINVVNQDFIPLDNDLLYRLPAPGKWSINQCLQHLNITGEHYLPRIKQSIEVSVCKCQKISFVYKSGWLGEIAVNGTKPTKEGVIPKPMKTFQKAFDPQALALNEKSAIPEFIMQQEQLLHYLQQAKSVNLNRNKITSLIPILRFRLGDAFRFLIAHEQRHILQAKNVLAELGQVK